MIEVDLHTHSHFSLCGMHTILEIISHARSLGMKGVAITDHGPTLGGRFCGPFFDRFMSPYPDITVYKGMECNVLDENGTIDLPENSSRMMHIILLGLHYNLPQNLGRETYTKMLLTAIDKNPQVDMITHPNEPGYPLDFDRIASHAAVKGIALELNVSRNLYGRSTVEDTIALLDACRRAGCFIAVCSDMHAIHELGNDEPVKGIIESAGFPQDLIVNRTAETTQSFLHKRAPFKS
jgi:putative hydrolase